VDKIQNIRINTNGGVVNRVPSKRVDFPNSNNLSSDAFYIKDIDKETEDRVRKNVENYKNLTLTELKKILKNKDSKVEFYRTFNAAVYNNFHDISKIIFESNSTSSPNFAIQNLDGKINTKFQIDDIEFVANVKSINRIIEKMERKGKETLEEVNDVVRGRINCKDVNQAQKILEILKEKLGSQNKEIIEVDDMINNPRPDYMGRIHLTIKDKETGVNFELQIGSKNITDFIERPININYGTRESFSNDGRSLLIEEDVFKSNYHDLIYKAAKKLEKDSKYEKIKPEFQKIYEKYVDIQRKIFESEKEGTFQKNKNDIDKSIRELDNLLINTFSKIPKEDVIKAIES